MNSFKRILLIQLYIFVNISLLANYSYAEQAPASMRDKQYISAVDDAKNPEPLDIYHGLLEIKKGNKNITSKIEKGKLRVRAITIINDNSFKKYYSDKSKYKKYPLFPDLWISVEPELINKIKNDKSNQFSGSKENNDMRIREVFGFPPDKKVDKVIIFWVNAENVFRPSPDEEIDDNTAELNFPDNVTREHRKWINNLRSIQFFSGKGVVVDKRGNIDSVYIKDAYPWTQLGYTYDWGKKCDNSYNYGLSEFIAKGNKNWGKGKNKYFIEIEEIIPLSEYIARAKL